MSTLEREERLARLIRVIQSLPADRMSSLGYSLGVAEAGITAGELTRRIYHVLSDRAGIERVLTEMSSKERLVLMMIASGPQGRSNMSRLEAETPFPGEELSKIVERLVDSALVQVSSPADQAPVEIDTPVEIRGLLRTGANRPHGRVAAGPRRHKISRMFPPTEGPRHHAPEGTVVAERAKRSGDPVSEITNWARQTRAGHAGGATRKRGPTQTRLAEVLGLWTDGNSSARRIEQWLALSNEFRTTITLRAWLHENELTFAGGLSKEAPTRRLVRIAFVGMLSRGLRVAASIRPQQAEEGLRIQGLERALPLPRYRWRMIVRSALEDLDLLGIVVAAGDGSYVVKSPSMRLVCANALEISPD